MIGKRVRAEYYTTEQGGDYVYRKHSHKFEGIIMDKINIEGNDRYLLKLDNNTIESVRADCITEIIEE